MLNGDPPDISGHKKTVRPRLAFFKKHLFQAIVQEVIEEPTTKVVTLKEKFKTVILPSLLVSGFGVLAIRYPHFFDDAELTHASGGALGFILTVLFFLFVKFSWNQIGGSLAIVLSLLAIVRCIFPNQQKLSEGELLSRSTGKPWKQRVLRVGIHAGADYIRQQKDKHSNIENH